MEFLNFVLRTSTFLRSFLQGNWGPRREVTGSHKNAKEVLGSPRATMGGLVGFLRLLWIPRIRRIPRITSVTRVTTISYDC